MLPLRFFASRSFSVGVAVAFALSGSLYGSVYFMAQFFQVTLGEDSLGAGLRLLPWTATLFVTAPLAGQLADRVGHRRVLSVGLLVQAVGFVWLAVVATADVSYLSLVSPLVISGAGISAALPVSQAAVVGAVTDHEIGKAAGTNNMLQELGGAFGVAATVAVFAAAGSYATPGAFADGFTAATFMAAAFAGVGFVVSLAPPRPSRPASAEAVGSVTSKEWSRSIREA